MKPGNSIEGLGYVKRRVCNRRGQYAIGHFVVIIKVIMFSGHRCIDKFMWTLCRRTKLVHQ